MVVVAEKPRRRFPQGSASSGVGPSTSSVTSRVVPCRVRSPTNCNLSPLFTMRFDLNSRVGYFSTSRKLGLRRSLSRSGWRVSIEPASMVAFTCDCVMSLSFMVTLPLTLVKAPLTFEIPRCRTVNWALEWLGSIFQVEVCAAADNARRIAVVTARAADLIKFIFTRPKLSVFFSAEYSPRRRKRRHPYSPSGCTLDEGLWMQDAQT